MVLRVYGYGTLAVYATTDFIFSEPSIFVTQPFLDSKLGKCEVTLLEVGSIEWVVLLMKMYDHFQWNKLMEFLGESPGLVVIGDDSFSMGRGFESQHIDLL